MIHLLCLLEKTGNKAIQTNFSPTFSIFSARRSVGPLYALPLQAHGASCFNVLLGQPVALLGYLAATFLFRKKVYFSFMNYRRSSAQAEARFLTIEVAILVITTITTHDEMRACAYIPISIYLVGKNVDNNQIMLAKNHHNKVPLKIWQQIEKCS